MYITFLYDCVTYMSIYDYYIQLLYMIIYEQFIFIISDFTFYKKNNAKNYSLITFYFLLLFIF